MERVLGSGEKGEDDGVSGSEDAGKVVLVQDKTVHLTHMMHQQHSIKVSLRGSQAKILHIANAQSS